MSTRRVWSFREELLSKSREAALNAVQTFNSPTNTFRTETFIVLMVIAWTYLLHSFYRGQGIEYRYFRRPVKRRKFSRTKSGAFKYWELERCLNEKQCPLDPATKSNLRFLIGLRHEIEHHRSTGVDYQLAGRYLACSLNYERAITDLFGLKHSLESELAFVLHFRDLNAVPLEAEAQPSMSANVARYIQEFDTSLPNDVFQSPRFSYRLLFTRKLTSKPGQADRAIEFISPSSELAKTIDKEYWVIKNVERPKHRPGQIVTAMQLEGYPGFKLHHHTKLWQDQGAKEPGKGYGVEVADAWFWYDLWVDEVRKHCAANVDVYSQPSGPMVAV